MALHPGPMLAGFISQLPGARGTFSGLQPEQKLTMCMSNGIVRFPVLIST